MVSARRFIGGIIAVSLGIIYLVAGQAHYSSDFTPDLAQQIEHMTRNCYRAFWFSNLKYDELKKVLGGFDFLTAVFLLMPATRGIGFKAAVAGMSGGIYGQLKAGEKAGQPAALLAAALLGDYCLG